MKTWRCASCDMEIGEFDAHFIMVTRDEQHIVPSQATVMHWCSDRCARGDLEPEALRRVHKEWDELYKEMKTRIPGHWFESAFSEKTKAMSKALKGLTLAELRKR